MPAAEEPRARRLDPVLLAMVVAFAAIYATFSLRNYAGFDNGGFDLGIFDQVVWHYSRLEAPGSSIKDLDWIWGDHFSPILMLLAPLYWVWDDARSLLLAQAVLLALAAVPIFWACRDQLGRAAALALTGAYLTFWGLASALDFDVHEVAFAPGLVAWVLLAARREAWRWYWPGLVLLLCVKEDIPFLVIALGATVALGGERRRGAITAALGVGWYLLAVKAIIPHFSEGNGFTYWTYDALGTGPLDAIAHVVTHPWRPITVALDDPTKVKTLVMLLGPFVFCLLSREALVLVPLLGERFWSSNENYWGTSAHYSLTAAAVLVIGTAVGLARLRGWVPPERRRLVLGLGAAAVLVANVAIGATFPLTRLLDGSRPGALATREAAARALRAVPDGASVATIEVLIPRLTHRDLAAEISPGTGQTDYVVANLTGLRTRGEEVNGGLAAVQRFLDQRVTTHVPVAYEDGWVVLRAKALGPATRARALTPLTAAQQAGLQPAVTRWYGLSAARRQGLLRCLATGGRCASAAAPSDAALQAALGRLRLSPGCAQLAELAGYAVAGQAAIVDAALPADPAVRARVAGALKAEQDSDAAGWLFRFQALCATRG